MSVVSKAEEAFRGMAYGFYLTIPFIFDWTLKEKALASATGAVWITCIDPQIKRELGRLFSEFAGRLYFTKTEFATEAGKLCGAVMTAGIIAGSLYALDKHYSENPGAPARYQLPAGPFEKLPIPAKIQMNLDRA